MSTTLAPGVAILGAGLFAHMAHLPALVALGDKAPPLRAVYSRSESTASKFAAAAIAALNLNELAVYHDGGDKAHSLDALLARSDILAVIVVLPITIQPSIVIKALSAGKHVLSEKPIAPDVATGKRLISTYEEEYKPHGLIWRVAENFEAEPGFRAAAAAVKDGKIGKVAFFTARVLNNIDKDSKWYKTPWRTIPDYQGGFLLDGGVHDVAALRTILPSPITHLSGFASLNRNFLAPHDTIMTVAKGESFHGSVDMTFANPTKTTPPSDGIVITGSLGWLSVKKEQIANETTVLRVRIQTVKEPEQIIELPITGVDEEVKSFFAALNGQDDGLGNPHGALEDVKFIQAALNSNGSLIDLRALE